MIIPREYSILHRKHEMYVVIEETYCFPILNVMFPMVQL